MRFTQYGHIEGVVWLQRVVSYTDVLFWYNWYIHAISNGVYVIVITDVT